VPGGAPPRLILADPHSDATMLFHTWTFAIFFLVTDSVYLALRRTRYWLPWLLIASYVFYNGWNPLYLFLMLCVARRIRKDHVLQDWFKER
jgi:hypothetical protein